MYYLDDGGREAWLGFRGGVIYLLIHVEPSLFGTFKGTALLVIKNYVSQQALPEKTKLQQKKSERHQFFRSVKDDVVDITM